MTKQEKFAEFVNAMSFSEVIEFFNFIMEDMMQESNHVMYDYHNTEDAITILRELGAASFYAMINSPTQEERAALGYVDNKLQYHFEGALNPWTVILDQYSEWILDHVKECLDGDKNIQYIEASYPKLLEVVKESKTWVVTITHTYVGEFDAANQTVAELMAEAAFSKRECDFTQTSAKVKE